MNNRFFIQNNLKYEYIKKIGFLLLFILFSSFVLHKYYVSVTEIYINRDNHSLDMVLRTFPDDLENVLSDTYHIQADLNQDKAIALLQSYIRKKMKVQINNKNVDYQFIKLGMEDDFYTILLQARLPDDAQSIRVKNTILQEMFSEQKNIIHFFEGEKKRSYILDKKNTEAQYHL